MGERMIEVPLEAFALLFAYCHTSAPKVPAHIKAHPAYPANKDHRSGHLIRALEPFAARAFATLKDTPK
jgi:hypothetical protein